MIVLKNWLKHFPNLLTSLNLLCGCFAIAFAFNNNLIIASYFILASALFDFFDGFAARVFKAYSELGKQFDSLADIISFGLAPAVILFNLIKTHLNISELTINLPFHELVQLLFPFLIVIFSGLRLAKFNIDINQSEHFCGLPTPANALFIISLPLIIEFENQEFLTDVINNRLFLLAIVPLSCFLLVSNFPMFGLKFKNFGFKKNLSRYLFIILSVILLITINFSGIPLIIILYISLSAVNNWIVRIF